MTATPTPTETATPTATATPNRDPFYIDNQFGADTIGLTGPREICVPSDVHP